MNKKGQISIAGIIILVLSIILVANLLIPQVKNTTDLSDGRQTITYNTAPIQKNYTLTNTPVTSGSVALTGLTQNINFSVLNYDTGLINVNATNNVTSTATYTYAGTSYLTSTGDRAVMAVVTLGALIGVLYFVFTTFGVI